MNNDHQTRNFNFGLPATMKFNLRHANGNLQLELKENKRLNHKAPIYVADNGNARKAVEVDVPHDRVRT